MPQTNPITSRATLITYCKRRLGDPVVELNLDDTQIQDRVDDALQYYQDYHYDGIERVYLKHKITPSTMTLDSAPSSTLSGKITGDSSGATATIHDSTNSTVYRIKSISLDTDFTDGETITDANSVSATLASSTAIVKGDIDNKYITITDAIVGVINVFPVTDSSYGTVNMFDMNYQLHLNDLFDFTDVSMLHYSMVMQHLSLLDDYLVGKAPFDYARHTDKLHLYINWTNDVTPDKYVVIECYRILDPETYAQVYDDMWLKRYTTALIKRQWGQNLSKFDGITLPGGLTYNGQAILESANEEITTLEEQMEMSFGPQLGIMVG